MNNLFIIKGFPSPLGDYLIMRHLNIDIETFSSEFPTPLGDYLN